MFTSILSTVTESGLTFTQGLVCSGVSIILGLIIAYVYMFRGSYSKNFVITLALLPVLVQIIIVMVNGNLGTSVAVLGAFGLIRFRSVPGSSKEIISIFFAMAIGLATGMGYITYAVLATAVVSVLLLVLSASGFGEKKDSEKELKITIPENLDYNDIFNDIFEHYTAKVSLERVKTVNLGSMYELVYFITFKDPSKEKALIDDIRCRNGNLTVVCGRIQAIREEL